jgi:hypothetical protein
MPGSDWAYELEYEGAPADAALLQVRLPSSVPQISARDVRLEVSGTSASVHVPGHPALEVQVDPTITPSQPKPMLFPVLRFGHV